MTPEHIRHLSRLRARVRDEKMFDRDEYEQSVHAKLYCIELSSVLEHLLRDAASYYCNGRSNDTISRFVKEAAKDFPNPRPDNIKKTLHRFDETWPEKLEQFWSGEIKDAVGSVVSNRHLIAHGRDCTISISRLRQWQICIEKLCDFIWKDIFANT